MYSNLEKPLLFSQLPTFQLKSYKTIKLGKVLMDELPFIVVLIRKIRAVVLWIVAAILAILLIIDYMENEEVASILTSVLIFLFIVIFLNYLFKKFFSQSSKDKE